MTLMLWLLEFQTTSWTNRGVTRRKPVTSKKIQSTGLVPLIHNIAIKRVVLSDIKLYIKILHMVNTESLSVEVVDWDAAAEVYPALRNK